MQWTSIAMCLPAGNGAHISASFWCTSLDYNIQKHTVTSHLLQGRAAAELIIADSICTILCSSFTFWNSAAGLHGPKHPRASLCSHGPHMWLLLPLCVLWPVSSVHILASVFASRASHGTALNSAWRGPLTMTCGSFSACIITDASTSPGQFKFWGWRFVYLAFLMSLLRAYKNKSAHACYGRLWNSHKIFHSLALKGGERCRSLNIILVAGKPTTKMDSIGVLDLRLPKGRPFSAR